MIAIYISGFRYYFVVLFTFLVCPTFWGALSFFAVITSGHSVQISIGADREEGRREGG